jgi:rubrerythrin
MISSDDRGCGKPSTDFYHDLVKALNGEYSAIHYYESLAKMASSSAERKRILEIRNDEIKHYHIFAEIYLSLTDRNPKPERTGKCPDDYCQGLDASFYDEQETVDFYNEIADKVNDSYIKEQFRRAALDEQNHAVWFSYFYLQNCRPARS